MAVFCKWRTDDCDGKLSKTFLAALTFPKTVAGLVSNGVESLLGSKWECSTGPGILDGMGLSLGIDGRYEAEEEDYQST